MKINFFSKKPPKTNTGLPEPVSTSGTKPNPPAASQNTLVPDSKSVSQNKTVQDIIAPSAIEVDFDYLNINNKRFIRTLFVAGYPRYVSGNWLSPLINFDHSLDISLFIYPVESKTILDDLRRKIAEMEAEISVDIERGKIIDPATKAKLEDAIAMQDQLVKGIERFFQFGLYVSIPAESIEELNQVSREVESTLASLLIIPKHATLQMEEGFKTTQPTSLDFLGVNRNMDTTSLATTFPFTSSELTANEGIMYGINQHNGSLIVFDRFTLENYNTCVFAKAGSGKSLSSDTSALFDDGSGIKLDKIGPLVEKFIEKYGATQIEEGIEGVINPNLKVWTFDDQLKGKWSNVTIAARKKFSPRNKLYLVTTKSGRQITVTADHNLVVLREGKIRVMRSEAIKIGEVIPVPRTINEPSNPLKHINPNTFVLDWPNSLPNIIPLEKEFLNLTGLITSEGHATKKKVEIYNIDPDVLDIIENSVTKIGFKTSPRYKYPNMSIRGFHILPNPFAKLIDCLGCSGKSGEKRIPSIIFSLSNQQVAHYLSAYFEGDGGVESNCVAATTKSKELASDLAYILLRFGIIARIRPKQKSAINTVKKIKNTYYQITISGKENLTKFANSVGFLTEIKNNKLQKLLEKTKISNTNVDTIPSLQPTYNYLYKCLFSSTEIVSPSNMSDLRKNGFSPSRDQLQKFILACEKRISGMRSLRKQIQLLSKLPSLQTIIRRGANNRKLNHQLWKNLGVSWNNMKLLLHVPLTNNVLLAYQTITGQTQTLKDINSALYSSFKEQGVSLMKYDKSLWNTLINGQGNSYFPKVFKAAKYISKQYRSTQLKIRHAEEKLSQLKLLVNSDLFWDQIEKIEKIKHKEKYVYDLQVDNGVFLAGHGGLFVHNSYFVKLEVLRSLMFDAEIIVIDPENEYDNLCQAVGGENITFGFNSIAKINPFDLSQVREEGINELNQKILSLHSLFKIIMGNMSPTEEAILDRALMATYQSKGITQDPLTQTKEPPLMEDLYKTLIGMEDQLARALADRIEKFIKGSFAGIFDQKSNVTLRNPFTIFSLRDMEDALRPVAMFIVLDFIWTKIRKELKKRILVVDEAWFMMRNKDSADFLTSIAKRARKYYLGVTTITQDVEDFLKDDLGKSIVTNSSIQILMKQHSAAIDRIGQVFYLSEGEKQFLLSCGVGEGLFFAGNNHVAAKIIASPQEHQLITSKPSEILARRQEQKTKTTISSTPNYVPLKNEALVSPQNIAPNITNTGPIQPAVSSLVPLRIKSEIILDSNNNA